MCGIAGIASFDGIDPTDRSSVARMIDALAHRGPDGRGAWSDDCAVLGHARLAVIDPAGGRQPVANEDGSVHAVINGEIYNHRELRASLESRGHVFRSACDVETVVHLYEEHGAQCVELLRGMFAIALWDSRNRRLILARDKIGIKPLYFARRGLRVMFASQLDALLECGEIERRVDIEALHEYLVYHYVPSPRSMIRDVAKLGPAQRAVISTDSMTIESYWDVSFDADESRDDETWGATLRDSLREAVTSQMASDVPIGVFLSGGLDSSAVAALMAEANAAPIRTFTVGFDASRYDERAEAGALAARIGADHHDELVTPDPAGIVEALSRYGDEPLGDPSAAPAYCISRSARRRVKVILSGDGGDELFAGYTRYMRHHREQSIRSLARREPVRGALRTGGALLGSRMRSALANLTAPHDMAHYRSVAWFDPEETRAMFNGDVAGLLRLHDPFDVLAGHFARCDGADELSRSQYVDMKTWLADGVLFKADRTSMACGLEVRVPMLDIQLVESMARLPGRLKIRDGRGKALLRDVMRPILGNDVVERRKRGFEVPMDQWFAGPLSSIGRECLSASDTRIRQWLRPDAIEDTWKQLDRVRRGVGARLWALLMLEAWARRLLTPSSRRADVPAIELITEPAGSSA